jgi:hypothetical protein
MINLRKSNIKHLIKQISLNRHQNENSTPTASTSNASLSIIDDPNQAPTNAPREIFRKKIYKRKKKKSFFS